MDVFRLGEKAKTELRKHIEIYSLPFKNKKIVDALKKIDKIPQNHPDRIELDVLYNNLEANINEAIVNTDEDFYGDYEKDGSR